MKLPLLKFSSMSKRGNFHLYVDTHAMDATLSFSNGSYVKMTYDEFTELLHIFKEADESVVREHNERIEEAWRTD